MRTRVFLCLPAALFTFGSFAIAQEPDPGAKRARTMEEKTMTGCLNKGEMENHYAFTDSKTGKKMTVTGSADLEKHSTNHTVKLTGTPTAKVFNVTKVEHVSATCQAPEK
jgi:hypothetical protein